MSCVKFFLIRQQASVTKGSFCGAVSSRKNKPTCNFDWSMTVYDLLSQKSMVYDYLKYLCVPFHDSNEPN